MSRYASLEEILKELQNNTKEMECIYSVERLLKLSYKNYEDILDDLMKEIPSGFKHRKAVNVKIEFEGKTYRLKQFPETPWMLTVPIKIHNEELGSITVYYNREFQEEDLGPFTNSEMKMLFTIADRLGHYILQTKLRELHGQSDGGTIAEDMMKQTGWRVVLDIIRKTEPNLFVRLLRKILHQLIWDGVPGAEKLLQLSSIDLKPAGSKSTADENKPLRKKVINNYDEYIDAILGLAEENIPSEKLIVDIQEWIREDRTSGLIKVLENQDTSLTEISDAIRKYYHLAPEKFQMTRSVVKGLRVSLLRRFFTDQIQYINIAKEFVKITDFYKLINKMVFPPSSHGKLGGKSAGLFLAMNILQKKAKEAGITFKVKAPKTWHITSDGVMHFMYHNDLEEVYEQKYKDIEEVSLEYPQIVQMFKSSEFPPDMLKGLSYALDDLGKKPLIVRSSSLMEDQVGAAFSGKYKSLFLANQGDKRQRLSALVDAVAEVYASTFGPDPIQYRAERGLIDFHEEMGIMIQEVVGTKVGKYYFPAFAGVAFSNNEFRWSPRIRRNDGLVRMVPGLGTRAVDRVSDDYPILVAPGQPNLRVNVSFEESVRYCPKYIDVINLETNEFETIELHQLLEEIGDNYPLFNKVFSQIQGNMLRPVMALSGRMDPRDLIANFEGLLGSREFLLNMHKILVTLEENLKTPVDIEFAHDNKNFYLLQCRPQHYEGENAPAKIPTNFPRERTLFTCKKYVSNGKVPNITHIVYVDPDKYADLPSLDMMKAVGLAVGKLNKALPKRKFILMGPGRWGSRGDIKLGVPVTYADINRTSVLIEIAKQKGNYLPDLSFGTHFFQDLAESSIRYLPLYPDDPEIIFNEEFFKNSENLLTDYLPEFGDLEEVIKVIDVRKSSNGLICKILMNAEIDTAIAILVPDSDKNQLDNYHGGSIDVIDEDKWRLRIAEKISDYIDKDLYSISEIYVAGDFLKGTSNSESKIEMIFIVSQMNDYTSGLTCWLDGFSTIVKDNYYEKTGNRIEDLITSKVYLESDLTVQSIQANTKDYKILWKRMYNL